MTNLPGSIESPSSGHPPILLLRQWLPLAGALEPIGEHPNLQTIQNKQDFTKIESTSPSGSELMHFSNLLIVSHPDQLCYYPMPI